MTKQLLEKRELLRLPPEWDKTEEYVEVLHAGSVGRIERVISCGQVSPPGFWYEQTEHEWVCVLAGEGEIELAGGAKVRLGSGESCFLPAGLRHRVSYTSVEPACVWLCVFAQASGGEMGAQ